MKKIYTFVSLCLLFISLGACINFKVLDSYDKSLSNYPIELTSHFPKVIPCNGVSSNNLLPAGASYIHYWGFQLFINYSNSHEKDEYLKTISDKVIDTITIKDSMNIFLTSIKDYCDANSQNYTVYALPNIHDEINMLNNDVFTEPVKYSNDWSNYKFLLVEQKDTIIYEEQKTNTCYLLESKLKHGFSRCRTKRER